MSSLMSYIGFQSPAQGLCLSRLMGRLIDRNKKKKIMFDMLGSKRVGASKQILPLGKWEKGGEGRKK